MFEQERTDINAFLDEYGYDLPVIYNTITSQQISTDAGMIVPGSNITRTESGTIKGFVISPKANPFNTIEGSANPLLIANSDSYRLITKDSDPVGIGTQIEFDGKMFRVLSSVHNHIYFDSTMEICNTVNGEVVSS